jgi:hypothetical protein
MGRSVARQGCLGVGLLLLLRVVEFGTTDPALREMTITISLTDADGGTDVVAVHDGLPSGLSTVNNELGWREALAKLAALVEAG